jgi:hypothetical protein
LIRIHRAALAALLLCVLAVNGYAHAAAIQLFSNNASTTLATPISSGSTSLAVISGTGSLFPALSGGNWFIGTLEHVVSGSVTATEIVKVTARSGDTMTIVRGQENTSPLTWSAGDIFALLPTAGGLSQFVQTTQAQAESYNFAQDTGSANAYSVVLTPALAAHVIGMPIRWKAAHANTGVSNFNDGAGLASLVLGGQSLTPGYISAGVVYTSIWDGAQFQLKDSTPPFNAQTAAEIAASETPNSYQFFGRPWLWFSRYCTCDGSTDDSASLTQAVAIANGANMALLIDSPAYINSNFILPANLQMVFVGAGTLKPGPGKNIALGQLPQAGLWQIFDYSAGGTVQMSPIDRTSEVWGEWWGANGDGTTNLANDVPINAALWSISGGPSNPGVNGGINGAGGVVKLGAGEFFISNTVIMQNYTTLRGLNNWTLIKAKAINWALATVPGTMINASNPAGNFSMFDSRIENMRLDANAPTITGVGQIVNSYGWQNRCGLFNDVFINYQGIGFNYQHGYGGAAVLEIANTDFFPNDFSGATGVSAVNDGSVGWLKLLVRNTVFASGGVNATIGLLVNNRIIVDSQNTDCETIQTCIQLNGVATLTGSGLSGGGASGINAMIHVGSTWTAPGLIDVSGVQVGAAAAMITDANRSYAYLALEPADGHVVHPSTMSKPLCTVRVTGGSSPVIASGQNTGVCSNTVTHIATGQNRITLSTSMDSASDMIGLVNSQSSGTAELAQVVPVDATHVDIYTYTAAGTPFDSSSFFVQLFHTP